MADFVCPEIDVEAQEDESADLLNERIGHNGLLGTWKSVREDEIEREREEESSFGDNGHLPTSTSIFAMIPYYQLLCRDCETEPSNRQAPERTVFVNGEHLDGMLPKTVHRRDCPFESRFQHTALCLIGARSASA